MVPILFVSYHIYVYKLPDITRSSEYRNEDFKRLSAVIGMASTLSPLNL